MAHTIGHRWPSSAPRGDHAASCDGCGVRYRRSQLRRMPSGLLMCSGAGTNDDARGREAITLDRANQDAYASRYRTPRQDPAAMDRLEGLLAQRLSAPPIGFWCGGERISSNYEGSLLQVGPRVVDEAPYVDEGTDFGFRSGDNQLDTASMVDELGAAAGYATKVYDQIGGRDVSRDSGGILALYPRAWEATYHRYVGWGGLPTLELNASASLGRDDACGISGDAALSVLVVCAGHGTVLSLGDDEEDLTGFAVELVDEESNDALGSVVLDYQGYEVSYDTARLHTMPSRQTPLYTVLVRRAAGSLIGSPSVRLDGDELESTLLSGATLSLPSFQNTGLRLGAQVSGGDAFNGYIYAAGLWDSYLSDADAVLVEDWAFHAIARRNDHRGGNPGSRQP